MNTLDQHLSEDQFEALLLGEPAPAATAHLAACSLCREKEGEFTSLIANFNQSPLDWSRFRSAHAPHATPARAKTTRLRPFATPAYAFAATLLVLLTLALSHFSPRHGNENVSVAQFSQPGQSGAALQPISDGQGAGHTAPDAQIAADNHLLAEIDSALDQPDPAPVSPALAYADPSRDNQPATPSPR